MIRKARLAKPFASTDAAHVVAKVCEALEWDFSSPGNLLKQIQNVEFGLSAEIEFAAILRWLGPCKLVHRLDQAAFKSSDFSHVKIPDLFAIFEHEGSELGALIEVKTTEDISLRLKPEYVKSLLTYGLKLNTPVLLAWRPRKLGFWLLLDLALLAGKTELDLGCIENDLMSLIAGDFWVFPEAGAGLQIEMMEMERTAERNGEYEAKFRIERAGFVTSDGKYWPKISDVIGMALVTKSTYTEHFEGVRLTLKWSNEDSSIRAQEILRGHFSFLLDENERIHWREVASNLDSVFSRDKLLKELQDHFHSFIKYIFFIQPIVVPSYIPSSWQRRNPALSQTT